MRKWVPLVLIAAMFAVAGSQYVLQLAPTAVLSIEGMSPQELNELGWTTHQSTGLDVVGVQSPVYLSVAEAGGEDVTGATWTVTGPTGSSATLEDITDYPTWKIFRADMKGAYTVSVDITTASGSGAASVTLTGAEYVGVGGIAGASPDFLAGQCAGCHSGTFADWMATNHSTAFTRQIDGLGSSHYAERCNECHTLGYDLTAANNGFDDVQATVGWVFPDTLKAGNWQDIVDNFKPLAQFTNIQCENCHGPGSQHKGNKANIAISVEDAVCGQCHEEEPYHTVPIMWKNSGHATGSTFATRGTRSGCADCHSTWGYIARIDPLSDHDQVVGMGEGITCAACHDPHSKANPNQLRTIADVTLVDGTVVTWGGKGKLCMSCHQARRAGPERALSSSTRQDPHRSTQTDMVAGNEGTVNTFGQYLPSSTHRNAVENTCVGCHMAPTPATAEEGRYKLGEHSFAMHGDVDGVHLESVAVCQNCHGAISGYDDIMAREDMDGDGTVEAARHEVEGLLEQVAMLLPPIGEPTYSVKSDWPILYKMAAFNYGFVEEDGTHGLHNFQFATGLLKVTLRALKYGLLAPGTLQSVTDVPNDQGKMVQVVWTRFGGDGPSDDQVRSYYVWRKDQTAGKGAKVYTDFGQVPAQPGDAPVVVSMAGDIWSAVGFQPAAGMEMYSANVPTLYDKTAENDAMTEFMVSAHTAGGQMASSNMLSGASEDNLVPAAPTGVMALATSSDVTLTWDESKDADFNYFAIYRGTTAGFDASALEPIGTTTDVTFADTDVVGGTTYFYRVAAFDFVGNKGTLSGEAQAAFGVGTEGAGLPTTFALHQNYPNPFNPTSSIRFDLPQAADVSVVVYDLLGRPVQTLASGSMSAGRHTVQIDATSWSSGLYIVRMKTASKVFERSILLVK